MQTFGDEAFKRLGRCDVGQARQYECDQCPTPVRVGQQGGQVHLSQLRQQDVAGDGARDHGQQHPGAKALELDLFRVGVGGHLEQ